MAEATHITPHHLVEICWNKNSEQPECVLADPQFCVTQIFLQCSCVTDIMGRDILATTFVSGLEFGIGSLGKKVKLY